MALDPSNSSSLEQLALKGLKDGNDVSWYTIMGEMSMLATSDTALFCANPTDDIILYIKHIIISKTFALLVAGDSNYPRIFSFILPLPVPYYPLSGADKL